MSSLERVEVQASPEMAAAFCRLLAHIMPRIPDLTLKAKSAASSQILCAIIARHHVEGTVLRLALQCLGANTAAMDVTAGWLQAAPAFSALLGYAGDARPKVRRQAQQSLTRALCTLQGTPLLLNASDAIASVCGQVLPGPEAAARAAAAASNKKRPAAEAAITKAVQDTLHLLGALKTVLPLLSGPAVRDAVILLSLTHTVECGFLRLSKADQEAGVRLLPSAFHVLAPLLAAEQEGVRFGVSQALRNLLAGCIPAAAISAAITSRHTPSKGSSTKKMHPLRSVIAALQSMLAPRHQHAWPVVLTVVAELFACMGRPGASLVEGMLAQVGSLCAGAAEAAEADECSEVAGAAAKAMGAAIQHLGPEAVLHSLPLDLQQGLEGTEEARTWLLPMLRQHALQCRALEAQLWASFPAFCLWPLDLHDAFRQHARDIGAAFEKRPDLRSPISLGLQRLCLQTRQVLQSAGELSGVGSTNPPGIPDQIDDEEEQLPSAEDHASQQEAPAHFTPDVAKRNLATLRAFAKNWLPLLRNAFVNGSVEERAYIGPCISAYAAISEPQTLAEPFRNTVRTLIKIATDAAAELPAADAVTAGGENASERRCTFLDLALYLSSGLDASAIAILYKAIKPILQERDQAVQKKAYKLLAHVCEQRQDFLAEHFGDVVEVLVAGMPAALSAAKRHRLRCLQVSILLLLQPEVPGVGGRQELSTPEKRQQVVSTLVSEIILCVKEVNRRTRVAAFELLIGLAHAMDTTYPAPLPSLDASMEVAEPEGQKQGGLQMLFTMVLGGLVGATPHMVAASVMALARLMYEFASQLEALAPQLLPVILSLLRSKSREIIKSVLGFLKVVAMRLPAAQLDQNLKPILEGLMIWAHDSKNKFKLKVRVIVERLARRCGFQAVSQHIPEQDRKLLAHIRKEKQRHERKRQGASEADAMGVDGADTKSAATRARTAARSEWQASQVFSDDEEGAGDAATVRSDRTGAKSTAGARGKSTAGSILDGKSRRGGSQGAGRVMQEGEEPMDLLDSGLARKMARTGQAGHAAEPDDFERDAGNRMIIKEDVRPVLKPKRKRGGGLDAADSEDSDFDDLRGIHGATAAARDAAKSVRFAASGPASNRGGTAASSRAGTMVSRRSKARSQMSVGSAGNKSHSGSRFKAKKGAGGDTKGSSKVEPYAYWPMDRRMLNRRPDKKREARAGLAGVVKGSTKAANKASRAKRRKTILPPAASL
ncbi:hypothetical protein WJX84_009705 [Apatococcus fuscideae]|uniref:Ribosomal RNA-processing protein 12-like conserved domain-containing protein n=1 Tax=Apatococcus fuscideae TaxID=2026836 RepID=A0AAW1T3U9_9CHLO